MSHKKAKQERKSGRQYSGLDRHKQTGRTLTPPWMTIPKMTPASWLNERLPEMVWVALLVTHLDRRAALEVIREVATYVGGLPPHLRPRSITHSALGEASPEVVNGIVSIIARDLSNRLFLKSLLLYRDLPARSAWVKYIGEPSEEIDWTPLVIAVGRTLNHQSQEATDCRWAKVLLRIASDKLRLATQEGVREITEYPDFGDQRKVRPTIRATEIAFAGPGGDELKTSWPEQFWDQCLMETPCTLLREEVMGPVTPGVPKETVEDLYAGLVRHALASQTTSEIDAKHDTVFGMGLFCVNLLRELLIPGNERSALGRMALRTILECLVTLAYLVEKNDPSLWLSNRVYGAGQAKLSFLKLDDGESLPSYVSLETLESLANEDQWQEFLSIDLGHWDKSNLRKMSETAGVKNLYDMYYPWPSAFVHGHWGAVRDTVLTTCLNPLHRLHRVPGPNPRPQNGVVNDACVLLDKIMALVDRCYPSFPLRVSRAPGSP
ncbi:MAG TPA: DUF5677 domain-containing protein [Bryobacteraceae bacterium]|nr:DUF5677 domain-containing protein [Bryobacteraceae bacterium]